MAIFTTTSGINEIRKKIGGTVFSKNHYGGIMRRRVKPVNPKSTAQSTIRDMVRVLSKMWKTIGQPAILAWNQLASKIPHKNVLGGLGTLTGEATFIRQNLNILQIGGVAITSCPAISANSVPRLVGVVITCVSGVFSMVYTPGAISTNFIELRSSGIVSAGITYNSKFKSFGHLAANTLSPWDFTTLWVAVFGTAPGAAQIIFFEYRIVDSLTGFATGYEKLRIITT